MTPDGVQLVALSRDEVLGRMREQIERLWRAVWPATTAERVNEILPRHSSRRGFRFLAALDDGALVGMAYGYLGGPGQWWHDKVAAAMTDEQRTRWLRPGHFELVELMVDPEHRRRRLGRRLHDELLLGRDGPAVLSTQVDNAGALALYRALGWQIIVPEIDLGAPQSYSVLGKLLGAQATDDRASDAQRWTVPGGK